VVGAFGFAQANAGLADAIDRRCAADLVGRLNLQRMARYGFAEAEVDPIAI
jgi:hypothetical protein